MMINQSFHLRPLSVAALVAGLFTASTVGAQEGGVATEEFLEKIQLGLAQTNWPNDGMVTARIENGRYVIAGFTDGAANRVVGQRMLGEIEGLDRDLVDIRVIRQ